MTNPRTPVEIADQMSRKRAVILTAAATVFLAAQLLARPYFTAGTDAVSSTRLTAWAVNAVVLLLILATGGGLLGSRQLRALVNDEVASDHRRTAIAAGFWVAMTCAMALFLAPAARDFTTRVAVYLMVTPSVSVAILTFAYLEFRAHGDA